MSILGALPTELIRVRDPLFDDDDIDAVLRDLMCQIETLRPLRDGLSTLYQLDQLPSQEMLAHAVAVIQQGDYLHGLRVIGVVPRHCSWRNLVSLTLSLLS